MGKFGSEIGGRGDAGPNESARDSGSDRESGGEGGRYLFSPLALTLCVRSSVGDGKKTLSCAFSKSKSFSCRLLKGNNGL